jgi:hypothetical protein
VTYWALAYSTVCVALICDCGREDIGCTNFNPVVKNQGETTDIWQSSSKKHVCWMPGDVGQLSINNAGATM